jgi:GT2 family glycosyltransferase
MNRLFTIGIPTINRYDLLRPTLQLYLKDFPNTKIIVVDNGRQPCDVQHPNIIYLQQEKNIGVAASWNLISKRSFGLEHASYTLFLNDDVYYGRKEDQVKEFLAKNKRDFYKSLHDDWCVFVLPASTWKKVGAFDTNFYPAYFEDRDYRYRMRRMGMSCMENVFFNPLLHRNSMSSEKDRSLLAAFEKNKQYYIQKWGGEPGHEKKQSS